MKKCPFCAEEIQDDAVKCKHCNSDLSSSQTKTSSFYIKKESDKKILKWFGIFILIGVGIWLWYISIPLAIVWYVWKKAKFEPKKKWIFTAGSLALLVALTGYNISINKTPTISISEPENNFSIQSDNIEIKGLVSPENSEVTINGRPTNVIDGEFSYDAKLNNESNRFSITARNITSDKTGTESLVVNRIYTEEEKAQIEAEKQSQLEAQRKAEEEQKAKELAEQREWEASKAGQICNQYPTWTKDECQRVADGNIWVGMHIDMLKYRRGLPDSANPSDYGYGRSWQWCWHDYTPSCFYGDDDGIVDSYN